MYVISHWDRDYQFRTSNGKRIESHLIRDESLNRTATPRLAVGEGLASMIG